MNTKLLQTLLFGYLLASTLWAETLINTAYSAPTQGSQYGAQIASFAIDGSLDTYNETSNDEESNWWQLDLRETAQLTSIEITSRQTQIQRIQSAKVYLSNTPYEQGELGEPIASLQATKKMQRFELTNKETGESLAGRYLIVHAQGANNLSMASVKVFGSMPEEPKIMAPMKSFFLPYDTSDIEIFTLDAFDYQDDSLRFSASHSSIVVNDDKSVVLIEALASGEHDINITATDGKTSSVITVHLRVSEKDALKNALTTQDASLVTSAELITATLKHIDTAGAFGENIKSILFNLADKNKNNHLSSISWEPTHDSASIIPTHLKNTAILTTNAHRESGMPSNHTLAVVGELINKQELASNSPLPEPTLSIDAQNSARYLLLGSNPMRNYDGAITGDLQKLMLNSVHWLTRKENKEALNGAKIVLAQMDESYYFKDYTRTKKWFNANYENLTINKYTQCDGSLLAKCLEDANLLVVSQIGKDEEIELITNTIKEAMSRGLGVLYMHHNGDLRPLGASIFKLLNVSYGTDLYWTRAILKDYDNTQLGTLSYELNSIKKVLTHLKERDFNFDFQSYLDSSTKVNIQQVPNFANEFQNGATTVKMLLEAKDTNKIAIFDHPSDYELEKLLILLGDSLRRDIVLPMDRLSADQNDFLSAYFADHLVLNLRDKALAQPNMGNFSRSDFSDITPVTKTVKLVSKKHFRSAGVYLIPAERMRVKRTDTNASLSTRIQINTLRHQATHEWSALNPNKTHTNGYTRPKYLTTKPISILPGEELNITSSYGGTVQILFDQNDIETTFVFENVGEHPHWRGKSDDERFSEKLALAQYDWAEIASEGFEVHSALHLMQQSVQNWDTPAPSAIAEAVDKYTSSAVHIVSGFQGPGIEVVDEIHNFAKEHNLAVPTMNLVKHMNADQATCGYGCSGNPYDAYWAFSPVGHGDLHELGHSLQNPYLGLEGFVNHSYTNPYSYYSKSRYHKDTGNDPQCQMIPFKQVYEDIAKTKKHTTGNWAKDASVMIQAAMHAQKFGELENGWHLYARMHLLQYAIPTAKANAESYEKIKNNLGFGSYSFEEYQALVAKSPNNNWTLVSLSFAAKLDFRPFFDMIGVDYSDKASAQVALFDYKATRKVYFASTPNGFCKKDVFGDYLDKAYFYTNDDPSWPEDMNDARFSDDRFATEKLELETDN